MTTRPQDTSAEEPDGGNPHIRFRGGPRLGDRPGLLNRPYAFQIFAVGRVAKQPELKQKGENAYTSVCVVGNDYGGQDKEDVVTSLYFTAFGKTAAALANNVRKGDQLVINGHIRNNNYADSQTGEIKYSMSYIIDGFVFGAPGREKRDEFAGSNPASTDIEDEVPTPRRRRRVRNG